MLNYFSQPWFSCFDGVDEIAAAAEVAAAAAAAAAGSSKTFTQDEVNKIVAADRRKLEESLKKAETSYKEVLANKNLTEQERKTLEENLSTVQGQLRTKEQQAMLEKKQLEEVYTGKIAEAEQKTKIWESMYRDSTVDRALQDAAVRNDAFNSSQITTLLRPWTRLMEVMDEKTGKPTGTFTPMVDFPDVDTNTGEAVILPRTPEEAVKRMKELPASYGNLFKSGVVSGIGSSSATGGLSSGAGGKLNVAKLTPEQYRKIRKENPELLGLRPSSR